jgi:hypothetical protein
LIKQKKIWKAFFPYQNYNLLTQSIKTQAQLGRKANYVRTYSANESVQETEIKGNPAMQTRLVKKKPGRDNFAVQTSCLSLKDDAISDMKLRRLGFPSKRLQRTQSFAYD